MATSHNATRRRPKTIDFWRGDLPHWQVEEGRYFVTMHLDGAIPSVGQQRIREITRQLRTNSGDDSLRLSRLVFFEMEKWLDRSSGAAYFREDRVAQIVLDAIAHRCETQIWDMHEFVVMPTHLHLFFDLSEDARLKTCLESFKRWTGHEAAKFVELSGPRFWQTEWFDHWSRSEDEDERIAAYICRNPEKAQLVGDYRQWPHGSWAMAGASG